MCGINSMVIHNRKRTADERKIISHIFTEALVNTEARGTHATGVALVTPTGKVHVLKANKSASVFVETEEYAKFLAHLESVDAGVVLGHTRHATHGNAKDMKNNHPFLVDSIVGVHNGVVHNYVEKRRFFTPKGQCDSELVFHALARASKRRAVSEGSIQEALRPFRGDFALAFVDRRRVGLHLIRQNNPLELVEYPSLGVTFANSVGYYVVRGESTVQRAIKTWTGRHYDLELEWTEMKKDDYCFISLRGEVHKGKVSIQSGGGANWYGWGGAGRSYSYRYELSDGAAYGALDDEFCHQCGREVTDEDVAASVDILDDGEVLCSRCLTILLDEIFAQGAEKGVSTA